MGATIGGTIKDTIGCLIMNAIFPPLGTAGREGETTAKRETSRENGAWSGKEDTGLRYHYTVSVEMF